MTPAVDGEGGVAVDGSTSYSGRGGGRGGGVRAVGKAARISFHERLISHLVRGAVIGSVNGLLGRCMRLGSG